MTKHRATIVIGFIVMVCDVLAFSAQSSPLDKFKISNQITGWVDDHTSYKEFTPEQLFGIIDGGASEYIDNGMQKGFIQRLKGPGLATIELFAEDFGAPENARKMLAVKRTVFADSQSAQKADTSSFVVNEVVGGIWVCGIVGRYYFELTVMGMNNSLQAKTICLAFFDYYRKIAASMVRIK